MTKAEARRTHTYMPVVQTRLVVQRRQEARDTSFEEQVKVGGPKGRTSVLKLARTQSRTKRRARSMSCAVMCAVGAISNDS